MDTGIISMKSALLTLVLAAAFGCQPDQGAPDLGPSKDMSASGDMSVLDLAAPLDLASMDLAVRSQPWDRWVCYHSQCGVFDNPQCDHEYVVDATNDIECHMDFLCPPDCDLAVAKYGVLLFMKTSCYTGADNATTQMVCNAQIDDACTCGPGDAGCFGRLTHNPCP